MQKGKFIYVYFKRCLLNKHFEQRFSHGEWKFNPKRKSVRSWGELKMI